MHILSPNKPVRGFQNSRRLCAAAFGFLAPTFLAFGEDAPPGSPSGIGQLSLEELMNMRVTTVSREEGTVGHSAAAVFVITPEMIRRSGATTFPEVLRMVPGINVSHIDSSKWAVGSRGFADRFTGKLQVQIDGRAVYNPVSGGVYWDTFDYPLQDVERIEVIRGPGASMYGANAVNGIINVITKPSKDTQGGLISLGGGSEEYGMATVRWGGKINDELYYRVYGKWRENGTGFNTKGDARDDWRQGRVGFRMDWQPHPEDSIMLAGEYYIGLSGRRDLRASPTSPSTGYIVTNTEDELSKGGNLNVRWAHDMGNDSKWTAQMYYDSFNRRGTAGTLDFGVNTVAADFQYEFKLGERQKVVAGAQYKLDRITFNGTTEYDGAFVLRPAREIVERPLVGIFVHDEISIVRDRFAVMLGAKVEHNEYTGFEFQPNARVLWTPSKKQTLWASVSRAVRTPTFGENDTSIATLPTTISGKTVFPRIIGNTLLSSEELIAYEIGYRAQVTSKVSLDAALFYNSYDKLFATESGATVVDSQTGVTTLPVNRTNKGNGETYGAEVSATWQITDWWRLTANYTYLKMNLHSDPSLAASSAKSFENIELQSPQNQVYLRSSFDLPGHVEFDVTGRYVDSLRGFSPGIPSYFTVDARLAWKPKPNVEFAIVGQNLVQDHHAEFGTSSLVRSPLVEVERSVYATVTLRW